MMKSDEKKVVEGWKTILKAYLDADRLMKSFPGLFVIGGEAFCKVYGKLEEPHAAVEMAIDIIVKSDTAFEEFLEAVKNCKHDWLADLISGNICAEDVEEAANRTSHLNYVKSCLTLLIPNLEKIDAREVAQHLSYEGFGAIITAEELERIECKQLQYGNCHAVKKLLTILSRCSPGWWVSFAKVVEKLNYESELVESLRDLCRPTVETSRHPSSDVGEERGTVNESGVTEAGANPIKNEENTGTGTPRMAANFSLASPNTVTKTVKKNNSSLREYQKHLARDAIDGRNVIICAPTGSGKTRVAAHVIYTKFKDALHEQSRHRIAFLVPRVPLAKQQSDNIKAYLSSSRWNVDHMVGDSKSSLREVLHSSQVIVLTPQILLNGLQNSTVMLTDFSMLIFDECHHTMKDSPYNVIMGKYLELKEEGCGSLPKVIGLTATLGVGKGKDELGAVQHMLTLCANLDATGGIVTVPEESELADELNRFTPHPEEHNVVLDRGTEPFAVCICKAMDEIVQFLYSMDGIHKVKDTTRPHPLPKGDQQYLQWCQDFREKAITSLTNEPELCRDIQTCLDYLKLFNEALDLYDKCRAVDSVKYFKTNANTLSSLSETEKRLQILAQGIIKELTDHSNDPLCVNSNLQKISEEIRRTFGKDRNSRVMLHVRKRQYAEAIRDWLNESEELEALELKAEYFTGVGKGKDNAAKGLTRNKQEKMLGMFRTGETKVLVCTPEVISEGVDIPDCNLVICYDYVKNEISKLQVKGRARKEEGRLIEFSSKKVMARDKANASKTKLMEKATQRVQALFKESNQKFMNTIENIQKQAVREHRLLKGCANMKPVGKPSSKFKVTCKKCGTYLCEGGDIVKLGTNHTCIKKEFKDKYDEVDVNDGGTEKKRGLFCKKCQSQWGIFSRIKRIMIPQLYPHALVFKSDDRSMDTETGSQWAKIKINFAEVKYEDMLDMVYNS